MLEALTSTVSAPAWLFWLICLFAAWSLLDRALLPWMRWYIRNRVRVVLDDLDQRLPLKLDEFRLTRRQALINRLLYDPAIQALAEEEMRDSLKSRDMVMTEIEGYVREIVPSFNPWIYFSIAARAVRWLIERLYVVRIMHDGDSPVEDIPEGSTVVYVMNHRSNLDYLMVGYMSANHGALSYAVGEWAQFWPLEPLVRSLGAYFVRRNSNNRLYRKVLERYVSLSTREGVTQAMFPEGGLTRDGHLRPAKLGLFGYMLRDFDPDTDREITFVPVAVNYDRVLEDRTLLASLDKSKPSPGLTGIAKTLSRYIGLNIRLMLTRQWRRYGMAAARFGKPVSISNWLAEHPAEDREEQIRRFAGIMMHNLQDLVPELAIPSLCSWLVSNPDHKWRYQELKDRLRQLPILSSLGNEAATVAISLAKRRHLLTGSDDALMANHQEMALIQYYAGSILADKA